MRRYTTAGIDDALAGLARALDELREDVRGLTKTSATLQDDVASHTRALATLAQSVAASAAKPHGQGNGTGDPGAGDLSTADGLADNGTQATSAGPAADAEEDAAPGVAWLTVTDPAQAIEWLNDLWTWVPMVWQPHLLTPTPECWPWHPAVVAELLVVRHLWADAVADADPAALAAWHDRWRPSAALRVGRLMAGCERAEGHHKISGSEHTYDTAYLDELAAWWAETHGTDPTRWAPGISRNGVQW